MSFEKDGDKVAVDDVNWTYTFKGNKFVVTQDGETDRPETFKLNEAKKPKEIDFAFADGVRATGIYELDGDRLTLRFYFSIGRPGPRPTTIKGPLGKSEERLELKRKKS
jgi:uncharacterized protein (TIGR03067 family)